MSDWEGFFDDSSEQDSSFHGASSVSGMGSSHSLQNDPSHQPGGRGNTIAADPFGTNLRSYAAQNAFHASSTAFTKSTGSERISHTACDGSVLGVSPRFPGPREPENTVSSVSSLNDPILEHFASRTSSASPTTSPIRPTGGPGTPSSSFFEATESDETDSYNEELNLRQGDAVGTPATSEASVEADTIPALDQDHEDQAASTLNRNSLLAGLESPKEYRDQPLFCDAIDDDDVDNFREILNEFLRSGPTNFQTRPDAIPWTPGPEGFWRPNSDEVALAPPPGLAYDEYYLSTRKYTRRHKKIQRKRKAILAGCNDQPTPVGSLDGPVTGTPACHQDISPYAIAKCPTIWIESRGRLPKDWCNNDGEHHLETLRQPKIYCPVDPVTYSFDTLVSIFHPSFLVSHFSRSSVSTLATDLCAPNGLSHDTEYAIDLFFSFGPPISLNVCAFTPRDNKALRSYQKHEGKDKLDVQDSLPIALNLFSVESQAEELDAWLDRIICSKSGLPEYVDLLLRRQKGDYSALIMKSLVSWHLTSKNMLSEPERQISRIALKLLITTTLLNLVPKVTNLPESLSNYVSSQSSSRAATNLSTDAPKLLTRQIKASIYHLQQNLLYALFSHFTCAMKLAAEVKVLVALLVAYVLELIRYAGREFAKFARVINSTVDVKQQDITQYETNMQTQVFDRVRASVLDATGRTGGLGEKLRTLGSIVKGKGKETQECQFVSVILDTVL